MAQPHGWAAIGLLSGKLSLDERKQHDQMTATPTEEKKSFPAVPRAVVVVLALFVSLLAPTAVNASPNDEAIFINGVNEARTAAGLPPLQFDVQLTELARGWTNEMANGSCGEGVFICHASPISAGVTRSWAKLGENVGTGPDIESVMKAFIASEGHYTNIVDPEFTHIGVGVVWDGARLYTTHRFMKLQGGGPPATTAPPATEPAPPATTTAPPVATTAPPVVLPPTTTTVAVRTTVVGIPVRVPPPTRKARVDVVMRAIVNLNRY